MANPNIGNNRDRIIALSVSVPVIVGGLAVGSADAAPVSPESHVTSTSAAAVAGAGITRLRIGSDVQVTKSQFTKDTKLWTTTFNAAGAGSRKLDAASGESFIYCRPVIIKGPGVPSVRKPVGVMQDTNYDPATGQLTPDTDCEVGTTGTTKKTRMQINFKNVITGDKATLKVPRSMM